VNDRHPRRRTDALGRPRVVVVAQAFPAQGGIATYAGTVLADPRLNEEFDLVLLNTTRRAVRLAGTFSLSNTWHGIVDTVRVWRAARRADVVHVLTALMRTPPLVRALALCGAARLGGAGVLCHVHTGLVNVGPNERFAPSRVQRQMFRWLRIADAVITVSDAATRGLAPFAPGARFIRLDNAVDGASFDPAEPAAEPPTILFVGTIAARKGVLDLVEALVRLRDAGAPDWRLELVGSGNEAGEEEARSVGDVVARAGLGHSLLGPLHGVALRERLRLAQLFVLPSHSEGQPIGILEAMASGLPVVATKVGGIPDIVADGVEGLLVDPRRPDQLAEALRRLIEAPALRAQMGEAGRRRVAQDFDLATLRRSLAAIYRAASRRPQAAGDWGSAGPRSTRPSSG